VNQQQNSLLRNEPVDDLWPDFHQYINSGNITTVSHGPTSVNAYLQTLSMPNSNIKGSIYGHSSRPHDAATAVMLVLLGF
jgi:hypothetical protein